jgi:catechol 1,2-dioxygenase
VRHEDEAPAADVEGQWYSLEHSFVMEAGESKLPRAPIRGKASGERPELPVLQRRDNARR